MNPHEAKAFRLVMEGKVVVETVTFHDDGRIDEAIGFVEGDTGTWLVHINGEETTCNCPYGTKRQDGGGHSHDRALELAANGYRAVKEERNGA